MESFATGLIELDSTAYDRVVGRLDRRTLGVVLRRKRGLERTTPAVPYLKH